MGRGVAGEGEVRPDGEEGKAVEHRRPEGGGEGKGEGM